MPPESKTEPLLSALAGLPERLLVGVSGGIDSVALLDALAAAEKCPVVLHFDHRWRRESAEEARLVAALAKKHGFPFIGGKAPAGVPKTESEARRRRRAFFARAARKSGLSTLVLAHHADDQVETFLLQLLRGSGSGWRGMEERSLHGPLTVRRPWLGIWRSEIAAYAKRRKLPWRDDPGNLDPRHLRNRLRHRLLPLLETEFEPQIRSRLLRTARIQGSTAAWIESLLSNAARSGRLALREFQGQPEGFQLHLLHLWLKGRGIADLSFELIDAARGMAAPGGPAKINLPRGRHLRRRAGFLFVED